MPNFYETDFHAWTLEQANLLRLGKWEQVDLLNLIEEVESLGRQERRELKNRLGILLGHLLKWQYQPEGQSKSWRATIREQRSHLQDLLTENPSLKPDLERIILQAYPLGLALVVRETPLDYEDLPPDCPFSPQQIFDSSFPAGIRHSGES